VGYTINHLAAVFILALGGLLLVIDYRIVFQVGAVMSAISLLDVPVISKNIATEISQTKTEEAITFYGDS